MPTRSEVLDAALAVLAQHEPLTLDAVARETGLTKPGVVHHVGTKQKLLVAVVDRIVDLWEADLHERLEQENADLDDPAARLRAYVAHGLRGEFAHSDLALIADAQLRDMLCQQWSRRLEPWFGFELEGSPRRRAALRAARLLADGAWFNASLDIPAVRDDERDELFALAMGLVDEGAGTDHGAGA